MIKILAKSGDIKAQLQLRLFLAHAGKVEIRRKLNRGNC